MSGFTENLDENLHIALEKILSENIACGCGIIVGAGGELAAETYRGTEDLAGTRPVNRDTVYRMYSMTKVVTVVAAMQLWEKCAFSLSDPLYKFIPEYKSMKVLQKDGTLTDAKGPILMNQLLTMTAGFGYDDGGTGYYDAFSAEWKAAKSRGEKWDTVTVARKFAALPLLYEPGDKYRYSFGYDILGAVIEVLSGETPAEYCKHNIFEPLGMTSAGFAYSDIDMSRLADFVGAGEKGLFVTDNINYPLIDVCTDYDEPKFFSGGSGMLSTLPDYFKLARVLAKGGEADGVRILSKRTVDFIRIPRLNERQHGYYDRKNDPCVFDDAYNYGIGVRVLTKPHTETISSAGEWGWSGALGTWLQIDPEEDIFFVYAHQRTPTDNELYIPYLGTAIYTSLK